MGNRTRLNINIRRSDNGWFILNYYDDGGDEWGGFGGNREFVFSTVSELNKFITDLLDEDNVVEGEARGA